MLYAMGSIGLLGFLVWSQWLAFLRREFKVINITIGWKGWYLLNTFYSSNVNKNAQSAGNLSIGSSETIRDDTYDLFYKNYNYIYKLKFKEDKNWLDWFIGFSEGDGAILEYNNNCKFVITQKDVTILEHIQKIFNFGRIKYYYNNDKLLYGRFIVEDKINIFLLYTLFNGNLYLNSRIIQLNRWYKSLLYTPTNNFYKNLFLPHRCSPEGEENIAIPHIIFIPKQITLNNAWLSGFTDAEGCFSVKIYKNRGIDYVKNVFILDQKNSEILLNNISILLYNKSLAKLRKTLHNNVYRIEISCNHPIRNQNILIYFNKYKLKTTKSISFELWCNIIDLSVGNQPLSLDKLNEIRKIRKKLNKYIIENNPIGHSSKS